LASIAVSRFTVRLYLITAIPTLSIDTTIIDPLATSIATSMDITWIVGGVLWRWSIVGVIILLSRADPNVVVGIPNRTCVASRGDLAHVQVIDGIGRDAIVAIPPVSVGSGSVVLEPLDVRGAALVDVAGVLVVGRRVVGGGALLLLRERKADAAT